MQAMTTVKPGVPTNHLFKTLQVSAIVAATSYVLWLKSPLRVAHLLRVHWTNRNAAASALRIGYLTLAAAFVQVHPDIIMLAGFDDEVVFPWPGPGNTRYGFAADTTAITGSLGNIIIQCSVAGAAPADIQVDGDIAEL